MLDAIKNAAEGAADKVDRAATKIVETAKDGVVAAAIAIAKSEIQKAVGEEIDVDVKDIPDGPWKEWICKTGINSLCNDQTWYFLNHDYKKQLWAERGIKRIILSGNDKPEDDEDWICAKVNWQPGETDMTIVFYPYALTWKSDRTWAEDGYKRWWNLCDEIVFGMQLYQLEGECFYKSDWLDGVEDPDPDAVIPGGSKKFKRWFQFRHWIIYWYAKERWGWNWQATKNPPPLPDGSLFNLDSVLSLPGMPDFTMPKIKLPSLPDVEMPSLPDAPSLPDMPSIDPSMPSMPSLPSIDLSNLSLGSLPPAKQRPKGRWACHGYIELEGLNAIAKGNKLILSDAKVTHFWHKEGGGTETETKEHSRFELECTNEAQAKSWVQSLVASGVKEGEVAGCCCTVA